MAVKHLKHSFKGHKLPVLVLDAGTTGIKAFVFDQNERLLARAYRPLHKNAHVVKGMNMVEEDPLEIVRAAKQVLAEVVRKSGVRRLGGMGITNQRETVVVWDKATGKPIYPAIVWEDERTEQVAAGLRRSHGWTVRNKTGLSVSAYFSATKIGWILDAVPGARKAAERGDLLAGTVDTWLLANLAAGRPHLTDYTNASRTLCFNVRTFAWDDALLKMFSIPKSVLPEALPSMHAFGVLRKEILGQTVPILAVAGDQEASMFAVGRGMGATKITFGTGAFPAQVIGSAFKLHEGFFTTPLPFTLKPRYMIETKVDDCGPRVEKLLRRKDEKKLREVIAGIIRKAARSIKKMPLPPREIIVDGGVTRYPDLPLMLRRATGVPVQRQKIYDGTALGMARMVLAARRI
jgi:glycerol kinase